MSRPLNLGFIGGGSNSEVGRVHFAASQLDNQWQLKAGAFSRNPDINRQTAETFGLSIEQSCETWQDLIDEKQTDLDAVSILLPSPLHCDAAITLLEAGIPVISEKPLITQIEDLKALEKTLSETKGFLAATLNYSGYPMIRFLKSLIQEGRLGEILQLQFEMPQESFLKPNPANNNRPQAWRLEDGFIPMISLDLGIHLYHLAEFLTSQIPTEVNAEYNNFSGRQHVTDDVKLWSRYENGMSASFWYSKTALGNRNGMRLRIFGSKGSADWYQENPDILIVSDQTGQKSLFDRASMADQFADFHRYNRMKPGHPTGFVEAFANLYSDIATELAEYKNNPAHDYKFKTGYVFGLDHIGRCIHFFHAASESNNSKSWINISSGT